MTYGPPGNEPPGPPSGGYGPPSGGPAPQGSYGAPVQGSGATRTGFDPKTVNPLDWVAMAAGVLAFIFSFTAYYKSNFDTSGSCPASVNSAISANSESVSAWHNGFFGWFGALLALVGAGLIGLTVFAPQVKLPFSTRLAAAGAFVLAALSTILAFLIDPVDVPPKQSFGNCTIEPAVGHGFGYWASLIVIIAGAVVTFMSFRQSGGQLPGRAASASAAGGVTYGQPPGYQPPQGPPPGYQPLQAPPPGYQPPQAPPPGYQPPQAPPPGYQPPQAPPQQQAPQPPQPAPPPASPQAPPPGDQPPQ